MAEGSRPVIWSPEARSKLKVASRRTADRIVRGTGEVCDVLDNHPFVGRARNEVRRCLDKEPFMLKFALIAAAASIVLSSSPALAKKVQKHQAQATNQLAPSVRHAPRYDWQAGDCDVTNKTSLNTCSNGGR
jgi:hypothetical protein